MSVPFSLRVDFRIQGGPPDLSVHMETETSALAIVGPSGCGKTTFLRVIAGLERRAQGRLEVGGDTWLDTPSRMHRAPWLRRVGWVPQDVLLFPLLSVRENLCFGAAHNPEPVEAQGDDLREVTRFLGISDLLDRRPAKLSGGERQRVALGRALLSRPRLLLMDEPLVALDRPLRRKIASAITEWCGAHELPRILVTHDDHDVASLSDEVWTIEAGHMRRLAQGFAK